MDDHVEDTDVGHLQRADDSGSEGEDYFDASDSCDSEGDVEYDIADEAYRSGYSDYKKTRMTLETLEDAVAMKEALSQGAQGFCEASDHGLECLSENGEENDAKPEWDDQPRVSSLTLFRSRHWKIVDTGATSDSRQTIPTLESPPSSISTELRPEVSSPSDSTSLSSFGAISSRRRRRKSRFVRSGPWYWNPLRKTADFGVQSGIARIPTRFQVRLILRSKSKMVEYMQHRRSGVCTPGCFSECVWRAVKWFKR